MKQSHEGSYKKASPSFEVSLKKSDYYEDALSKAASTLELNKGFDTNMWVMGMAEETSPAVQHHLFYR